MREKYKKRQAAGYINQNNEESEGRKYGGRMTKGIREK